MELRLGLRALAVTALALLTAAAGVAGFATIKAHQVDHDEAAFLRRVLPAQSEFEGSLTSTLVGVTRLGLLAPDELDRSADGLAPGLELDGLVVADGPTLDAAALELLSSKGVVLGSRPADASGLAAAVELARDTATLRATPPVARTSGGSPVSLLVMARYGASGAPESTGSRRTAVQGYIVAALRPERVAERTLSRVVDAGGGVEVRDGATSLYAAGKRVGDPTVRTTARVGGRTWSLLAGAPSTGTPAVAWLALAAGLATSAAVVATGTAIHRDRQRSERALRRRDEDLAAVAGLGPLLQESLELATVLPAAAAFLSDRFDLSGVSITQVEGDALVEAYSAGRRLPDRPHRPAELRTAASALAAGETGSIPLLRGGRMIGALHVCSRSDVPPERMSTLVALAEMLGTALANARQFEREQDAVRRLREIDLLQQEFLGTVSHELQTPITAILGFSSILDTDYEELTPDERREYLSRVARNATSLGGLVHQLLDLSRIGRSSFDLRPQRVDMAELIGGVVSQFEALADKHRLAVQAVPGVWAMVDTDAFERILSNLLSNAVKFSPPGSPITVTLAHDDAGATVYVDDAGPGVSQDDRPHVFRRFYRGSSDAAVATRGAGIGLAVVDDLVQRMHGRVWVETAPGGGARFSVFFPADADHTAQAPPSARSGQGRVT